MQANVARSFLRLALAINGVTDKYGNDEFSFKDFNLKLPIFVSADFIRNEHTCSCSANKHPMKEDEEKIGTNQINIENLTININECEKRLNA